ncbi:MAG: hypothetical protein PVH82_15635, partial [Desulfobacteraceae bacterium]
RLILSKKLLVGSLFPLPAVASRRGAASGGARVAKGGVFVIVIFVRVGLPRHSLGDGGSVARNS